VRRLFLLVSAVVLVDTAFYAAISPLLPHYQAEFGLTKAAAGVLTASYAAGTLIGSIPAGWAAGRIGVKRTLLLGLGLMSVTSVIFGFAHHVLLLDAARFLQGVGGACSWAAGMAWLVSGAPYERRGELIGSAIAAAIVGVMLGPVLGGAATVVGPEVVFGAVAVAGAGLAAWAFTTPGVPPGEPLGFRVVLGSLRRRPVAIGFWLMLIPAVFSGVLEVLAPLRLHALGASGAGVAAVFLVAAIGEAVASPIAGRLSDRRGRLMPIRIGLVAAVVMAVLLPLPGTVALMALVLFAAVASLGTFWAPAQALLADASDQAGLAQGLAFALANLAWSGGHVIGGSAGGALAQATTDAVPYGILALITAGTVVLLAQPSRVAARPQAPQGSTPSLR
jgi:MFS family permease